MKQVLFGVMVCALALTATTFAQFETFDCGTPGTTGCTTTGTGFPYSGWTNDPADINTSFRLDGGSTSSFNTGPSDDLTGGGLYVYLETSCGPNPNEGRLVEPVFDATGIAAPTVRFWYHMWNGDGTVGNMGTLSLEESNGAGVWTQIWTLSGNQGNMWNLQEVAINTYAGTSGPEVQFRFVGMRGNSFTSDMAIDNVKFGEPGPPPPPPAPVHQANSPTASLEIDGVECIDFTFGVCGAVVPEQRSHDNGALMTWTVSSGPNGLQPYALFHTPGFGANFATPGIPTVAGFVDFSLAGFGALDVLIDGVAGTSLIDALLGDTTASGTRNLEFTMPAGGAGTTFTTAQALVVDPTAMVGLQITQATQIDRTFSAAAPGLPMGFLGNTPVGSGDDTAIQVVFTTGFVANFYGASYSDVFVNSNGSVTFGGGDTDFTETLAELDAEEARIAGWWDDLSPNNGGSNEYAETICCFVASWVDVPEFTDTGSNSFGILIDNSGTVQIAFGGLTSQDAIVGISPGFNSPAGPSNPSVAQNLATAAPGSIVGGPLDAIVDSFTTNPGYGSIIDPCVGVTTGVPLLSFFPNPPMAIAGDMGYTGP